MVKKRQGYFDRAGAKDPKVWGETWISINKILAIIGFIAVLIIVTLYLYFSDRIVNISYLIIIIIAFFILVYAGIRFYLKYFITKKITRSYLKASPQPWDQKPMSHRVILFFVYFFVSISVFYLTTLPNFQDNIRYLVILYGLLAIGVISAFHSLVFIIRGLLKQGS